MKKSQKLPSRRSGVMRQIKALYGHNRLGEIMLIRGFITPSELHLALTEQKKSNKALGRVMIAQGAITYNELYGVLLSQIFLRFTATLLMFFFVFSSFGIRRAKAEIKDVPALISFNVAAGSYGHVVSYPGLFDSNEKRSGNLSAFTKWSGMFNRLERQINTSSGKIAVQKIQTAISDLQGLPLKSMAAKVNSIMNEKPYILDNRNWGQSDYWATPIEFMAKGGDCEDFAIAKYTALRALGVPEERMRVVIVQDTYKNIPHAVLVVYTNDGAYILDNQNKSLVDGERAGRYKPIFSINRTAWWLHTTPGSSTQVASR